MDQNILSEDEFVQHVFELNEKDAETDPEHMVCETVASDEHIVSSVSSVVEPLKEPKRKRRANLGEFGETQTVKRKNEAAKRELTSIVTQLGKIDRQLNAENDASRVSMHFNAKFTSFKSNRVSTFNFPPGAEVKRTLLDYETTVSVIKNVVKEAVTDIVKVLPKSKPDNPASSEITPEKSPVGIQAFPSPVTGTRMFSRSLCGKNSCSFGKKLKKPVWVKCSHRNEEGYECNYWVHSPCIGFPTASEKDVKLLMWYCPDHTDLKMKRN